MELIPLASTYFFPSLMALAVIYYGAAIAAYNNAHTYSGSDKAENMIFNALTTSFLIMVAWIFTMLVQSLL